MTIFDPTKIIPVGTLMFGRERFAYIATEDEDARLQPTSCAARSQTTRCCADREQVHPDRAPTRLRCADVGVGPNRLWLLKKDAVFRHTLTKATTSASLRCG